MPERLAIASRLMLWIVVALVAAALPAEAKQLWLEEELVLTASDGEAGDQFGWALDRHGDVLVVGAIGDDDTDVDAGAGYVFEHDGSGWVQTAKLLASDGAAGDQLGGAVSVHADTIVLGARHRAEVGAQSGAAYVFVRSGDTWTEDHKLVPDDLAAGDRFGFSVSNWGDKVLVGSPKHDSAGTLSGAAYLFVRESSAWTQLQKLEPSDATHHKQFGHAVSIWGPRLAVGAPSVSDGINTVFGRAYVFVRQATTWVEHQALDQPYGEDSDGYGFALSLKDDRLAVGAPYGWNGRAFLYLRSGDDWTYDAHGAFTPLGQCCARYASALDVEGDTLVAGAWNEWPASSGMSYYHERNGNWWHYRARMAASEREYEDELGYSVAIEDGVVFSGAPGTDELGEESGSVYVHSSAPLQVSTPFCFGDGSDAPCPCGNETPPGNGDGCANTNGHGCALYVAGSVSLSANDLNFFAHSGQMSSALLFTGSAALPAGKPFGGGLLCLAPAYLRLGVRTGGGGLAAWYWHEPVEEIGGWGPGDTRVFQIWYRVLPSLNPCGEQFSTSNALEITFSE